VSDFATRPAWSEHGKGFVGQVGVSELRHFPGMVPTSKKGFVGQVGERAKHGSGETAMSRRDPVKVAQYEVLGKGSRSGSY
jgi:hypothetical protein